MCRPLLIYLLLLNLSITVGTSIMRARSKHGAFFDTNSTHIDNESTARRLYWQPLLERCFVCSEPTVIAVKRRFRCVVGLGVDFEKRVLSNVRVWTEFVAMLCHALLCFFYLFFLQSTQDT
jgi:hypothetical protein